MPIIQITSLDHPGIDIFCRLTEAQLRNKKETSAGIFIAESPKVIHVALDAGFTPVALLCEKKHITGDAAALITRCGDIPIYTGNRELLAQLTGYTLTRGVLCAMRRPQFPTLQDICADAHRLAVIKGVVDTTNIGAIFRSAAALGIDGILITPDSCDPLNRRAVRVSMGSVFLVPWTCSDGPHRRVSAHQPSRLCQRNAISYHTRNRRRRTSHRSHRPGRLCGAHPNVTSSRFSECCCRLCCRILGIEI